MTIGKSSKKNKAAKSPPYLDRASGFYGRLDETEVELNEETKITDQKTVTKPGAQDGKQRGGSTGSDLLDEQQNEVFDFNEGMLEDDGTTLLKRKPSRLSQRWSRKSSRKAKSDKTSLEIQSVSTNSEPASLTNLDVLSKGRSEMESICRTSEHILVQFSDKEDADDQVLITEKKKKQREMNEMRIKGEMKERGDAAEMKVIKRSSFRNYCKVLDKALRQGWETFVYNLNSVTLSPISSSSSPTKAEMDRKCALANFR